MPDPTARLTELHSALRHSHPMPRTEMGVINRARNALSDVPATPPVAESHSAAECFNRPSERELAYVAAHWVNGGGMHTTFVDEWRAEAKRAMRDPGSAEGVGGVLVAEAMHQPPTTRWLYRGRKSWRGDTWRDLSSWTFDPSIALIFAGIRCEAGATPVAIRLAPGAVGADLTDAATSELLTPELRRVIRTTEEVVTIGHSDAISDEVRCGVRIITLRPTSTGPTVTAPQSDRRGLAVAAGRRGSGPFLVLRGRQAFQGRSPSTRNVATKSLNRERPGVKLFE